MNADASPLLKLLIDQEVLRFGDFTLKSGRQSPYFFNLGALHTGAATQQLAESYAQCIVNSELSFDLVFGPAYKGIPIAVAVSEALARLGQDIAWGFNRKEEKDHGEGGVLVGHTPVDGEHVLIVEDVTTAGTSIRETVPVLRAAAHVALAGLVVSVDRCERGTGDRSALDEVGAEFAMPTFSIVTVHEVIEHLHGRPVDGVVVVDDAAASRVRAYLAEWGA